MTAIRLPRRLKCCTPDREWNDLLLSQTTSPGRNYTYEVDNAIPAGGTRFGKFRYFDGGDVISSTTRIGPILASFTYDVPNRIFTSNLAHSMVPLVMGGLWPSGMHLADVIAFDALRSSGLMFLHGGAFRMDGKTICIFSPPGTGKTTAINDLLQIGAEYIGEDVVLTDGRKVLLVPPYEPGKLNTPNKRSIRLASQIDRVYLYEPGRKNGTTLRARSISQLRIFSNRVPFYEDGLVQSLITYNDIDFRDLENRALQVVEELVDGSEVRFVNSVDNMVRELNGH